MSEEMDQFHELKEYFRNVIAPTYSEWNNVPNDEKIHAKAIFIGCVGKDLIDYIRFDNFFLVTIQHCFNENWQVNQLTEHVNLIGYFVLDRINKDIDDHVSKIFYECTPSAEYKEINHET